MRSLSPEYLTPLVDFLATHVVSEGEREALLIEAFALVDPRLYHSIERPSGPRDFALRLVRTLLDYETLPTGEHALTALLMALHGRVGTNWQAQIDEWLCVWGIAPRRTLEIAYLKERLAARDHIGPDEYIALAGSGEVRKMPEIQPFFRHLPGMEEFQAEALARFVKAEKESRTFEDIVQGMAELRRAVLLGAPGAGKTTALRKLEVDIIQRALADEAAPLPLFVALGRWLKAEESLEAFLAASLGALGSYFGVLVAEGRLVLLLDGLNEIPMAQRQDKIAQVRRFLAQQHALRVLLTCRREDYSEALELSLDRLLVEPLDAGRIRTFVQRALGEAAGEALFWQIAGGQVQEVWAVWQAAGASFEQFWGVSEIPYNVFNIFSQRMTWRQREVWQAQVCGEPTGLLGLGRNPYLLVMMVAVHHMTGYLPPNRGALFEMFVLRLLGRERLTERNAQTGKQRPNSEGAALLTALQALAFAMQQRADEGKAVQAAVTALPRAGVLGALMDERQWYLARSTNLLDGEEVISFSHQLLQEYFAACQMRSEMGNLAAQALWPPERWWERTGWEEATILLAGLYSDDCTPVLEWVGEANPEVAALCLARSGAAASDETKERLRARWLERLTDAVAEPSLHARAAVGRALALAELDNRPGVGLRADGLPDIVWVRVPEGELLYQEGEMRTLPTFWLAKYLVTNWQWSAFVADGGYETTDWWKGLRKPEPVDLAWDYGNHPRAPVDWYETVAFCRWLSARLGYEVRLPTEEEWEKAVRGASEAGPYYLGQTSAVGIYPQESTPEGVLDLGGNVWEWTLTEVGASWGGSRVLRGGFSLFNLRDARDLSRPQSPDNRLVRGFRVASSAPRSGKAINQ